MDKLSQFKTLVMKLEKVKMILNQENTGLHQVMYLLKMHSVQFIELHASTAGIPAHLPSAAGFLVEKEINYIGKAVSNPERPMVAILGGAKVSDKILVIENLLKIADKVIVGGGMCYTFAKAQGHSIGNSLVEDDRIDVAKDILAKAGDKLILPVDSVINTAFAAEGDIKVCGEDVPDGYMGLDIWT